MRQTRRLTSAERWELGLFLSMLIVGCLCFTAILNLPQLPHLFAFVQRPSQSSASATPAASPPSSPLPLPTLTVASLPTRLDPPPISPYSFPTDFAPPPTASPQKAKRPALDIKWFGGQKYYFVKTLRLRVTAYSPDERCCWPYPGTTTASGMSVKTNHGRLVAADTNLIPMHALVSVPGYAAGAPVPVLDRGGAIKGHRLDVLLPTFNIAKEWGSRVIDVKIYMPLDE